MGSNVTALVKASVTVMMPSKPWMVVRRGPMKSMVLVWNLSVGGGIGWRSLNGFWVELLVLWQVSHDLMNLSIVAVCKENVGVSNSRSVSGVLQWNVCLLP